jgi:hypothetical protein
MALCGGLWVYAVVFWRISDPELKFPKRAIKGRVILLRILILNTVANLQIHWIMRIVTKYQNKIQR